MTQLMFRNVILITQSNKKKYLREQLVPFFSKPWSHSQFQTLVLPSFCVVECFGQSVQAAVLLTISLYVPFGHSV